MKRVMAVAVVALVLGLNLPAETAELGTQKLYEAIRVSQPPVLDGRLDDACWQQARSAGSFWKLKGADPIQQTLFQVAYDERFLYLAFTNLENNLPALKGDTTTDDMSAVMGDDAVEWFLQPDGSGDYYQFAANCRGARYDGCAFDAGWNGDWRCATGRTEKAWTLEVAVAFATFRQFGVPGARWGLQVCRDRQAGGDTEWSAWSPSPAGFHQPDSFGRLIFGGQGGGTDRATLIECARAAARSLDLEKQLNDAMATIRGGKLADLKPEQRRELDQNMAQGQGALDRLAKLLQGDKPLDTRAWIETNEALQTALAGLEDAAWQVKFEQLLGD